MKKAYALHFQIQTTVDSRSGRLRTLGTWLFNFNDEEATDAGELIDQTVLDMNVDSETVYYITLSEIKKHDAPSEYAGREPSDMLKLSLTLGSIFHYQSEGYDRDRITAPDDPDLPDPRTDRGPDVSGPETGGEAAGGDPPW